VLLLAVASAFVGSALVVACGERPRTGRFRTPPPPVPASMAAGESLYVAHCQPCHGTLALGTDKGPPLVHAIYLAPHHADAAFILAIKNGVRAHHWTFGDMAAVPGVDDDEAYRITSYLRWLQGESEYR
jgi:mono/diheme cytochrome c family protein